MTLDARRSTLDARRTLAAPFLLFAVAMLAGCFDGGDDATSGASLSAPTNVAYTGTTLTWGAVVGAGSYAVYANCQSDCSVPDRIGVASGTSFTLLEAATNWKIAACADVAGSACGTLSANAVGKSLPSMAVAGSIAEQVISGQLTSLSGSATPTKGATVQSWQWSQFGNDGDPNLGHTAVTIDNSFSANASFVAPSVTVPTRFAFMLLATDSTGAAGSSIAVVTVQPKDSPIIDVMSKKARVALAGETVTLHAKGSATNGTYSWKQINPDSLKFTVPAEQQVSLVGANTANPSLIAPAVNAGGSVPLAFEVIHTDNAGKASRQVIRVNVNSAAATTGEAAAAEGNLGKALTLGTTSVTAQNPVAVQPTPDVTVVAGGQGVQLSMPVAGGNGARTYSWRQIDMVGAGVPLANINSDVLTVTTPVASVAETLSFELTVTDSTGQSAKGVTRLVVLPVGGAGNQVNSTPATVFGATQVTAGSTTVITATGTGVVSAQLAQVGGREGKIIQLGDKKWSFIAPNVTGKEAAKLSITKTYQTGATKVEVKPLNVVQTQASQPATAKPVAVIATLPLTVVSGDTSADEGTKAAVNAAASGGTGTYTYTWDYLGSTPAGLAKPADFTVAGHLATFTTPKVTATTLMNFRVTVSDGKSTASKTLALTVHDIVTNLVAAAASDAYVLSGQKVSLSFPRPIGGMPPYTYAVSQTSGATVALSSASSANPSFTAPTLIAGAANTSLAFKLTVTDFQGAVASAQQNVTVVAPVLPFVASLDALAAPVKPGTAATDAGATLQGHSANGVAPVSYAWTFADGTTDVTAQVVLSDGSTANPTAKFPAALAGIMLNATLTATDNSTPKRVAVAKALVSVDKLAVAKPLTSVPARPTDNSTVTHTCSGWLCLIAENETNCPVELVDPVRKVPVDISNPPSNSVWRAFALVTIEDNTNYKRSIVKRCASAAEVRTLWWDNTSDNNGGCMTIYYNQDSPNGLAVTCHYGVELIPGETDRNLEKTADLFPPELITME